MTCNQCDEKWYCYEEHKLHMVRGADGMPLKMLGEYVLEKNKGVRCLKDVACKFPDDNGGYYPLYRPGAKLE